MDDQYKDLYNKLKEDPSAIDKTLGELPVVSGREYRGKSKDARIEQYKKNKALRARMLENKVPFITPEFDPDFFLCQGMTLIGAMPGQSKSTTCANILAGFIQHCPGKQAIVIANEEGPDAVIDRVACVLNKKNYVDLYKGRLTDKERKIVEATAVDVASIVEVVDDTNWDMTCLEDVQSVLDHAATTTNMVILDYLQIVTHSKNTPGLEAFQISKILGLYLKEYGKRFGVPVLVFAQLHGKSDSRSFQERVQNDKTIYNHAFNAIEIIPDFKTLLTKFILHKGRFELKQGKEITMRFVNGRYEMDGFDI